MSNRMNNVQIDGATERDVFGLGATGTPGAEVNAKPLSIEAVKELQVLLAPFDVRQGNFGGFLLNAITKTGTNQLHGSAFHAFRNQEYGADTAAVRGQPFNRSQTGFSLGGPIIKDKLHFFTANEWTTENTPVSGPYADQPASAAQKFPLAARHAQALPRSHEAARLEGRRQRGRPSTSRTRSRTSSPVSTTRSTTCTARCCDSTTPTASGCVSRTRAR